MGEARQHAPLALAAALASALALASCASIPMPDSHAAAAQPGAGQTACLVRGLGGGVTSWVEAGRPALEALGFKTTVHDWTEGAGALAGCGPIIGHSLGGMVALEAKGTHQLFIIDGFSSMFAKCPVADRCLGFYEPIDAAVVMAGPIAGAKNINCLVDCAGVDALPYPWGHMAMARDPVIWGWIIAALERFP